MVFVCVHVYMYIYVPMCVGVCACYMDVMCVLKTRDIQLSYTFSTLNSFWPFFSFWQETKDTPFSRLYVELLTRIVNFHAPKALL